jgi:small subunit ribosomal protein S15Ae
VKTDSSPSFALVPGYVEEFEEIDDHRSGKIVVQLNGRINKTGVISPRFNIQLSQIENWINLLLPARSFGYIILTTSAGIMDHEEARRKHVAGKILGKFPILFTLLSLLSPF